MNSPSRSTAPMIIAHRGASGLAPENTLAAFELALEIGVDGVEFDVQLSADEQAVVIHDLSVDRTTPATGRVSGLSANRLSALDAGEWFHRRLKTHPRLRAEVSRMKTLQSKDRHIRRLETVPSLDQVLHVIARVPLKRIFIELKGPLKQTRRLLPIVLDSVRLFRLESVVTILSFDHQLIELAAPLKREIRTGALFSLGRPGQMGTRSIIRRVRQIDADEAALHFALATPRMVDALHSEDIAISVWTVNSKLMMRRLAQSRVDAIMTNFPNRLAEVLKEPADRRRSFSRRLRGGRLRRASRAVSERTVDD
jgi:glycerophosphoryl diester phosphodiesterase